MAGFEKSNGVCYKLVGKMELENGPAAKTVKQVLTGAGFDLVVERKESSLAEKIKIYAREII